MFNLLALRGVCLRERIEWDGSNSASEWRLVLHFSLPALLSSVPLAPVAFACNALLISQPGGYSQMGIFNAANLWFSLMLFIPGISNQALLPILASRDKPAPDDNDVPAHKIMWTAMRVTAWAAVPLTVCICLLSPVIMGLYGSGFSDGWKTLCFAAVAACVAAMQLPASTMLIAARSMWLACLTTVFWGSTYYGLSRMWVTHGSDGISLARTAAYAVNFALTLLLLNIRFFKPSNRGVR
jgi:O-antigen/teichoic acid export membrane protein